MFKVIRNGKTTGPDYINNRILKELSRPLSAPLCELFNFSVSSGKVPDILKQVNITPIFKKDSASVFVHHFFKGQQVLVSFC